MPSFSAAAGQPGAEQEGQEQHHAEAVDRDAFGEPVLAHRVINERRRPDAQPRDALADQVPQVGDVGPAHATGREPQAPATAAASSNSTAHKGRPATIIGMRRSLAT